MAKSAQPSAPWKAATLRDFPPGARYLIGVSGGRDSVVLLHWLQASGYRKLVVCHLDHSLRGRVGRADASFVERLAARAGLPFESEITDVKARAATSKTSIETAARLSRLEFFAEVSRRRHCRKIFLGHHADDLVETFLFNLLRGSGIAGLRAIRAVSQQRVKRVELTIVRPLLGVWREEIDRYIATHQLRFREDASNRSLEPTRNRLRHRIIPMIEKEFGRPVRQSLWRAAEIAGEEHAALDELMPPLGSDGTLPLKAVRNLPVGLQRRVIRRWLSEERIADVGFDLIESVRGLLDSAARPAKVNLPRDRYARRRAGQLFIE